jgi:scyllo-inositol 2-dehydrogenase (NADP+)
MEKSPGTAGWGTEGKEYWGKLNTDIGSLHFEGLIETVPGNYLEFYKNVYGSIRTNGALAVRPEESRDVIKLIEACYESHRLRKAVKI